MRSTNKRQIKLKWKKDTTVTGYQCQLSTGSKFVTNKTYKTYQKNYKKNEALPAKIEDLESGKKYYIRIRAYKTVNGTKYYGTWSSVKSMQVK